MWWKNKAVKRLQDVPRVPPEKGMEMYLKLRNQALHSSLDRMKPLTPDFGPAKPSAAVMDLSVSNGVATVVAYVDGTASIYLSSGGGYIGGGQRHESIRSAGQHMLSTVAQSQPMMHLTEDFPLPQKGHVNFYLVTGSGVFTAGGPEAECRSPKHPLLKLYAAAQEVITQYRLISPRGLSDPGVQNPPGSSSTAIQ
jgi:hypothetical protein